MKGHYFLHVMLLTLLALVFLPNSFAEEFVVRQVYFYPSDREPSQTVKEKLDMLVADVQQFYADQMERHGFGRKTFRLETDAQGQTIRHYVRGKFPISHYDADAINKANLEIDEHFDRTQHLIYLLFIDTYPGVPGWFQVGGNASGGPFNGTANITLENFDEAPKSLDLEAFYTIAHELGHAFGLTHDFRDTSYMMSYGTASATNQLSFCATEWLDVHRYFNDSPTTTESLPTIRMLAPTLVSAPNIVRLQFEITHSDPLHQAQLLTNAPKWSDATNPYFDAIGLIDCKSLNGTTQTIEFDPIELFPVNDYVALRVIDKHGNFNSERFPLDINALLPDSDPVSIPDVNLATAIRENLGLAPERPITKLDMLGLGNLQHDPYEEPGKKIKDLTGIQHATNLKTLRLPFNEIRDITLLTELTQLEQLRLTSNRMSDVSPLAKLVNLSALTIDDNRISDLSPLTALTNLLSLDLSGNQISDLTPIATLTKLKYLALGGNRISDLTPLTGLIQLTTLELSLNNISDISPLAELKQLLRLNLYSNNIPDVSPIVRLNLTGTEWDSVGLDIEGNPLNAASINTHIPAMRAKGIVVAFGDDVPRILTTNDVGPKIEGPWVWMIVPTETGAPSSNDWLAAASKGSVTETQIATNGATEGERLQNRVWTLSRLTPTGENNIGEIVNTIGWGEGYIADHVAYGSIVLNSPREQKTLMYAGSDDNHKVWLNGELVRERLDWHWAHDYQESFSVTLKQGKNVLLVAIENIGGPWGGYFGFASDAEYTDPVPYDINGDGTVDGKDVDALITAIVDGITDAKYDVNADGTVDVNDVVAVNANRDDAAGAGAPARLGNLKLSADAVNRLQEQIDLLIATGDQSPPAMRTLVYLQQLLATETRPEKTQLLANYPNPFNPETWIPYQLAQPADVTLTIYDVQGRVVRALDLGHQAAAVYQSRSRAAYWDGRNAVGEPVASGLYFYTLTAGDFSATRKLLIRK